VRGVTRSVTPATARIILCDTFSNQPIDIIGDSGKARTYDLPQKRLSCGYISLILRLFLSLPGAERHNTRHKSPFMPRDAQRRFCSAKYVARTKARSHSVDPLMAVAPTSLTLNNEGPASGYPDCSRCAGHRAMARRTRRASQGGLRTGSWPPMAQEAFGNGKPLAAFCAILGAAPIRDGRGAS
jgi:hypothetical protein